MHWGPGMMGWLPHMGWWNSFGHGGLFMMIFWVMALILFASLLKGVFGRGRSDIRENSEYTLEILKRRFARGEIDESEFLERRRILDV